ncbi:Hint domain-containing protein [Swaminathania salitolerans]|uniref:Hedgehog/Intein (Hint) domain-containing protein n=1 Tax=Swaminathania salitolerans TaxID=182838 RepID=A0A511BUB5_9PROT|nr:Hint domain-containing protein [Swaminathania salitolerans]GBQ15979.1 outer membrane protein [Swaminathania salitolerans LMG 21291]GEL01558.1 hypothetical protein SSA02_07210 [Swaminathania salitolerans]
MTIKTVNSGQTTSNPRVVSGDTLVVSSGGVTDDTVILSGGVLSALDGARVEGSTTISAGGILRAAASVGIDGFFNVISGATFSGGRITDGNYGYVSQGGNLSGTTVSSGGEIDAGYDGWFDGGALTQVTVAADGWVNAFGTSASFTSGSLSGSGATVRLAGGAVASSVTVGTGATLLVSSGSVTNYTTVDGGKVYLAATGASNNTTFTSRGGTVEFGSAYADPRLYVASSNVSLIYDSGAALSNVQALSGARITVTSGARIDGQVAVSAGGTLVLNGAAGSGTIGLDGDGAHLVVNGTTMPTNVISGFSAGDTIDLTAIPKSSIRNVIRTTSGITFQTVDGNSYTLAVRNASTLGYALQDDGTGRTLYTTCFAAGTMIRGTTGDVAVEDLTRGDLVETLSGPRPVLWVGHRHITVETQPVPEENWLVRFRAGALAEGIPSRDLLVTQEHCMVFEGKLVPARMLVNDRSIVIDRSIGDYTYYHVEFAEHEAIWAEDALTESYLDSGNRSQFANADIAALHLPASRASAGSDRLPLATGRDFVEPIHRALADRASMLYGAPDSGRLALCDEPRLQLLLADGTLLFPHRRTGSHVLFALPSGVTSATLISRSARPCDTMGRFVDDRRLLGVLVGDITLFDAHETQTLTSHLVDATLPGWNSVETAQMRWTSGAAKIELARETELDGTMMAVAIKACGPYSALPTGALAA